MTKSLFICFFSITVTFSDLFVNNYFVNNSKIFIHHKKPQTLGISIVLYRVDKADKMHELSNLEKQFDKTKSINLYKITEDLGIIFMNTAEPYNDTHALPYKMLFGNFVQKEVANRTINGFIPSSEVSTICDWIKKNKIDSYEGFSKWHDNLSSEAKQALEDIDAEDKKSLFSGYVEPLTAFYFNALQGQNSIIICGE